MPLKESLYDIAESQKDNIKHRGFEYKDRIFEKTMSNFMFRSDQRKRMLAYVENVMYELIERTKMIKNHANYVVSKRYRNKN
jgi:hypothetical protein